MHRALYFAPPSTRCPPPRPCLETSAIALRSLSVAVAAAAIRIASAVSQLSFFFLALSLARNTA